MRKTLCALALVSLALFGAGCNKGPSLVGKWSAPAGAGTVDFEFKGDDTFTMGTKMGQMGMTAKGAYKLTGDKLSLTIKDLDMPGLPPAVLAQAKSSPEFSKPQEVAVKFVSDDELSMSGVPGAGGKGAGQAITLKRAK